MRFFSQFPEINYKIGDDITNTKILDIYRHVDVNEALVDDLTTYTHYNIKDGERPDVVSFNLYDTPEYHWTFFIINEALKDGLNGWPRGYLEQQTYIEERYGNHSILEFKPKRIEDNGVIKYENYFGSLDFTDPNLNLKRTDNDTTATAIKYDPEKLQLWVTDLSSGVFLSNNEATYALNYSSISRSERDTWLSEYALPFVRDFHPNVYENLINDVRVINDDIRPYIRGSRDDFDNTNPVDYSNSQINIDTLVASDTGLITGSNFVRGSVETFANDTTLSLLYNEYLDTIEFKTSRSWVQSYNAPYRYFDANGDDVNAYDELTSSPDSDNFISYYQAEDDENDEKRQLRVLRKSDVEAFAEYYKELINE